MHHGCLAPRYPSASLLQPGVAPIVVDPELPWVAGLAWNCTDILPGEYCHALRRHRAAAYAQAARQVRAHCGQGR